MFWGITIENGKRYSQIVDNSFHVSMAALECKTDDNNKKSKPFSVMIEHEKTEYLLCTLDYNTHLQQALDLNFIEGEEVTFFINGSGQGTVHLTGYLIDRSEDEMDDLSDMDMEDEESEPETPAQNLKRRSASLLENMAKKKKVDMSKEFTSIINKKKDSEEEEEEEEDDDDDDTDSSGEITLNVPTKKQQKANSPVKEVKSPKCTQQKTPSKNAEIIDTSNKTPNKQQNINQGFQSIQKMSFGKKQGMQDRPEVKTPQNILNMPGSQSESEVKKKKKKKKNKGNQSLTSEGNGNKSINTSFFTQSASPSEKLKPNTPKTPLQKKAGGTVVDDILPGSGPVAKQGRFVQIMYVGKLTNNKVFDKSENNPLKFRLGKGEVIKGMDIGIEGMKVGGKRRITIPPQQGYGNKKTGSIPPNSTLVFEVELKSVS